MCPTGEGGRQAARFGEQVRVVPGTGLACSAYQLGRLYENQSKTWNNSDYDPSMYSDMSSNTKLC